MSVGIHFEHIVKKYGENVIIPDLNLDVKEGEFFTLLGPSGCGKTTLLRMVAGFNSIEGGTIAFNGKVINDIAPNKRNIGMVFQNYAVFPHMTVRENVAFGLENRHLPKNEIKQRVDEILETVKITQYADRLPERLSGGQQQRVALARAIVIKPDVLLMDEPLSNLDAKLRIEMRNAIRQIQNSVGITTIYVTHDQEEAMAVSDRIAVMYAGQVVESGTADQIFYHCAHPYTRGLLESIPRLNAAHDARLTYIGGTPPDALNPAPGCAFSARCKYAMRICRQQAPEKREVQPGHFCSCFLMDDEAEDTRKKTGWEVSL